MEPQAAQASGAGAGAVLAFGPGDTMTKTRAARASQREPAVDPVPSDDEAWRAVLARDARFDGRVFYAVRSTGVYCRPTCPSRRPRRQQACFFADAQAAERAGFRACRRCRPHEAGPSDAARCVLAARSFLDARAGERVTLEQLGRAVGLSPTHLQRVFTRVVGLSPKAYSEMLRLERLQARLRGGADVAAAGYHAGYGSASRVYEQAAARLGMTPGRYRRGGAGVRLRVATAASPLGRVLIAASERGVCALSFGASDAELLEVLRREYPRAEVEPAQGELDGWLAAALAHVDGRAESAPPPLDVPGTAFQWRVWRALQAIPPGETRTYGELAAALGMPRAARAVARACASNRVALLVPCHRVVAADGVGGYRWGAERKEQLLRAEQAAQPDRRP